MPCMSMNHVPDESELHLVTCGCIHAQETRWQSGVRSCIMPGLPMYLVPSLYMYFHQGLSQDLETGCPKLVDCKIFGRPNFIGGTQYTQISTINRYRFIKIRHDILIQCHVNYTEMKKFNYMHEIDILRNSSQTFWVS